MNTEELINAWKAEERIAHIHGWDFSHIRDRYTEEEDLPWDYREIILRYLRPEMRLLKAQRILEKNGCIEGKIHRFLLVARK